MFFSLLLVPRWLVCCGVYRFPPSWASSILFVRVRHVASSMPLYAIEAYVVMIPDLFFRLFRVSIHASRPREGRAEGSALSPFCFFEIVYGLIRPTSTFVVDLSVSVVGISWRPFGGRFSSKTSSRLSSGCAIAIVLLLRVVGPLLFVFLSAG